MATTIGVRRVGVDETMGSATDEVEDGDGDGDTAVGAMAAAVGVRRMRWRRPVMGDGDA